MLYDNLILGACPIISDFNGMCANLKVTVNPNCNKSVFICLEVLHLVVNENSYVFPFTFRISVIPNDSSLIFGIACIIYCQVIIVFNAVYNLQCPCRISRNL